MRSTIKNLPPRLLLTIRMDDVRLTVVSDPTQEFPHNQNNRFKVRLPRTLTLPEGPWAMSVWSLSVPDEAMERRMGQSTDLVCLWSGMTATLWNVQNGKYTSSSTRTWTYYTLTLADVFQTQPKTGVEFWTRVQQRVQELNTKQLQVRMGAYVGTPELRVTQPQAWIPTFRWEGEDLVMEASYIKVYDVIAHGMNFALPLKIAQAFGLMTQDPVTKAWKLGPNLIPSLPKYNQPPEDLSHFTVYSPQGPTQALPAWTGKNKWETFRVFYHDSANRNIHSVILSAAVEWRFIRLNQCYARLTNQLDTVMVYTDAVQSNAVNHRQVPLLRSLHLTRGGQGRVTVEPLHREWIPLNGNTLETLEI